MKNAFALPLVLWSVAFLSGLSLLLLGVVSHWLDAESLAERRFAARQNALTGVALGMHPAVAPGDALLNTGNAERDGHEVRISNEGARINPNFWLNGGERGIFQKLFASWDVDAHGQNLAMDGMADWIDPDDFVSLNGAERGQYKARGQEGFPPNEPFASVAELEAVIGLQDILANQENWRDIFTVRHQGKISILHASLSMLTAVGGLTPSQAGALVVLRSGEDGIDGNRDDKKFASLEEVAGVLNASPAQAAQLEKFFTLEGGARRIESTGWAQGSSYEITAVVTEGEGGGRLLGWEERP